MGFDGSESSADKEALIRALNTHQINTIADLRRVEIVFAQMDTPDVAEPMTAAWAYYVNSHTFLTELRALTRNYPFNSDCLDEAKRRVYEDPSSNKSWNLVWLVLTKIQADNLIPYYATHQAAMPQMWGDISPTTAGITQLAAAFVIEWTWAVEQMLRHWKEPPCAS